MRTSELKCVICGTPTDAVRGWDDKFRCVDHAPEGPRPSDLTLAEYLLEGDQGHIEVTHEPCGQSVLQTLRVHVDTLARIAREHVCPSLIAP